jgi:hypothetical protein
VRFFWLSLWPVVKTQFDTGEIGVAEFLTLHVLVYKKMLSHFLF